jgi:dimethylglycine dehydrogenase
LYDLLVTAGTTFGLGLFGARALNALRLEKGWGSWAREFRPIYGPIEAGLGRFLDFAKGDFIGREAALREREEGPRRRLVTLIVDAGDADVIGDEPIWSGGSVVGWVTSGGYAHSSAVSVALGYVPAEAAADPAAAFEVEILDERRPARLQLVPLFDPDGVRIRK